MYALRSCGFSHHSTARGMGWPGLEGGGFLQEKHKLGPEGSKMDAVCSLVGV
jgi:hypothetical protein